MSDNCFVATIVHGPDAASNTDELQTKFGGARVTTDADDLENGDLLLLDDLSGLEFIADNVLLLSDNRAPLVRVLTLEEALG